MPTESLLALLLERLERELPGAVALREQLHAAAEPAHHERRTAELIDEALGLPTSTVAGTGRLALIGANADSAPVGVRAELDGLPLVERTGAPFSASGACMHACGHDVHMAALVALARALRDWPGPLPAPMLAVFQPSEEAYPSGAAAMLAAGLGGHTPRAIVAAHIHPQLAWGEVAIDPGTINASCDEFEILIEGEATHGAYPHLGRDPLLALAEIVTSLVAQAPRRVDPLRPSSLTVGVLHAGSASNLVAGEARASGALRAYDPDDRRLLQELVGEVSRGVAAAHGCRASVELRTGEPPLSNDPELARRAADLLDEAGLARGAAFRSCGSDDFAFFSSEAPLAMAFVGLAGAPGFSPRPLHHPELLPPPQAVGAVARTQALLYLAAASATW